MNSEISVITNIESPLMDFEGYCKYMNLGATKAREVLKRPGCPYIIRIGRRVLIHKGLLDKELERMAKFHISIS